MGIYRFKLPDIGEGVVEAEITAWYVAVGDTVDEDQPLADAMTDKATIELTSPVAGVIQSLACDEGDNLAVGADLVVLEVEGAGNDTEEDAPAPQEAPQATETETPTTETPKTEKTEPITSAPKLAPKAVTRRTSSGKVLASPAVRKRAEALGLDLAAIPKAGERIDHADLDAFLLSSAGKAAPAAANSAPKPVLANPSTAKSEDSPLEEGEERIKVIGLRRVIAQRMQEAKRHIPHFTYVEEIDVTALEDFRARTNAKKAENKPKITVLPLIIRGSAASKRIMAASSAFPVRN